MSYLPNLTTDGIPVTPSAYIGAPVLATPGTTALFFFEDGTDGDFNDFYGTIVFDTSIGPFVHFTVSAGEGLSDYTHALVWPLTRTALVGSEVKLGMFVYDTHGFKWTGTGNALVVSDVPEPSSLILFAFGLLVIAKLRR